MYATIINWGADSYGKCIPTHLRKTNRHFSFACKFVSPIDSTEHASMTGKKMHLRNTKKKRSNITRSTDNNSG